MVSFEIIDLIIIAGLFLTAVLIGFAAGRKKDPGAAGYILSGRNVGLFLFILTNVSTWYGGILGVGEFTYRYGLASWFTQGLPYYIFAFAFAILLAKKIRESELLTIPDKLLQDYGRKTALTGALLVFILVSPAPYLLMIGKMFTLIFEIELLPALVIVIFPLMLFMIIGGYRSNLFVDAFLFFIMFGGFIMIMLILIFNFGGLEYLETNLPAEHLSLTGGESPVFIIVWFLIALWTFADPGFHQRVYSARNAKTARNGILISIGFWALFDFLTNGTGLFARAILQNIDRPVLAFPLLAEEILSPGLKGFFYAAMFATILSTLNSFLFLAGTTLGRDFFYLLSKDKNEENVKKYSGYGLIIASITAVGMAYAIPSVVDLWYAIGSVCIPGLIMLILGSYLEGFKIPPRFAFAEVLTATVSGIAWYFIRENLDPASVLYIIEPMLVGLITALLIHFYGMYSTRKTTQAAE